MRIISRKKLRSFWTDPDNPDSEPPLRKWYQVVKAANWTCFADVRNTYNTADLSGAKVVFDVGGNKFRVIAVIDYEGHKVFIRFVLNHEDYEKGRWKSDPFGKDWKPRTRTTDAGAASGSAKKRASGAAKSRRRKGHPGKGA
jgi:mRNA interferase HigB